MKKLRSLPLFFLLAIVASCSKNNGTIKPAKSDSTKTGGIITTGTITGGTGVYVAGYESFYHVGSDSLAVSANVPNVAKVWKNNTPVNLTDGTYDAMASAVYANSTTVYVAGYEKNAAGFKVATLWKNGPATRLGDGNADTYASSVTVNGSDVYVTVNTVTSSSFIGAVWKNGAILPLSNCAVANSVAIYGGKYYVCGTDNGGIPTLWTNGVGVNLLGAGVGNANMIFISASGQRYIAGDFENNGTVPGYWNNEKFSLLGHSSEGYPSGEVLSVYVNGNDVYLLGFNAYGPVLWENGVSKQIYDNEGPANGAKTYSGSNLNDIYFKGTSVILAGWKTTYVVGSYTNNVDYPLLWTAGIVNLLSNGDSAATAKLYNKTGGRAEAVFVVN